MTRHRYLTLAIGTGLLLLIPLVLTLRDGGVEGVGWNWGPGDFVVMGVLLFATGAALDFVWRRWELPAYRLIACSAVVLVALTVWVELATGGVSRALGLLF